MAKLKKSLFGLVDDASKALKKTTPAAGLRRASKEPAAAFTARKAKAESDKALAEAKNANIEGLRESARAGRLPEPEMTIKTMKQIEAPELRPAASKVNIGSKRLPESEIGKTPSPEGVLTGQRPMNRGPLETEPPSKLGNLLSSAREKMKAFPGAKYLTGKGAKEAGEVAQKTPLGKKILRGAIGTGVVGAGGAGFLGYTAYQNQLKRMKDASAADRSGLENQIAEKNELRQAITGPETTSRTLSRFTPSAGVGKDDNTRILRAANLDAEDVGQEFKNLPVGKRLGVQYNPDPRGDVIFAERLRSREAGGPGAEMSFSGVGTGFVSPADQGRYAEGLRRAHADKQRLNEAIEARLASGDRSDREAALRLAVTPEQREAVNAAYNQANLEASAGQGDPVAKTKLVAGLDIAKATAAGRGKQVMDYLKLLSDSRNAEARNAIANRAVDVQENRAAMEERREGTSRLTTYHNLFQKMFPDEPQMYLSVLKAFNDSGIDLAKVNPTVFPTVVKKLQRQGTFDEIANQGLERVLRFFGATDTMTSDNLRDAELQGVVPGAFGDNVTTPQGTFGTHNLVYPSGLWGALTGEAPNKEAVDELIKLRAKNK